ncbi:MAG: hypothetical protein Q9M92_15225 [Enterobacterales bacterium]|nr:hypothetical protein [Enterobacterales bacterium]
MPSSFLSQLANTLDFAQLLTTALKLMFASLLAYSVWLVVFCPADKIAESFLDGYFWVLMVGFILGALFSTFVQRR